MREKKTDPQTPINQQKDFSNWLKSVPRDVLQELYELYIFQKENILSRRRDQENAIQVFPEVNTNKPPPRKEVIVLRRSIFFLLGTILGIEIFFDLFYFGLRFFSTLLPLTPTFQVLLGQLSLPLFIILNLLKICFMFVAAISWVVVRYEIVGDEIRFKYGLLFTKEKIYICTYTQEVNCNQSLFGRIFNYGTIEIYNPTLKESIYIDAIPNPQKYVGIIKANLPDVSNTRLVPL